MVLGELIHVWRGEEVKRESFTESEFGTNTMSSLVINISVMAIIKSSERD